MKRSSGKIVVFYFLSDPGVPGVRSTDPDVSQSPFANLTDATLADEDSNSICQYVDRAILGNVAMQVAPPGSLLGGTSSTLGTFLGGASQKTTR